MNTTHSEAQTSPVETLVRKAPPAAPAKRDDPTKRDEEKREDDDRWARLPCTD
jgi:hypothetical protein